MFDNDNSIEEFLNKMRQSRPKAKKSEEEEGIFSDLDHKDHDHHHDDPDYHRKMMKRLAGLVQEAFGDKVKVMGSDMREIGFVHDHDNDDDEEKEDMGDGEGSKTIQIFTDKEIQKIAKNCSKAASTMASDLLQNMDEVEELEMALVTKALVQEVYEAVVRAEIKVRAKVKKTKKKK